MKRVPPPFGSPAAAGDGAWPSPQRRSVLRALTRGQRVLAAHRLGDVGYDLRVLATWQVVLNLQGLLDGFTMLDLGIARWRRSKQAPTQEDRLVELRIAMESILLAADNGVAGEKTHRLAIRGAWLLGETLEQRKRYFRILRDAYAFASSVIHAGRLKKQDRKTRDRVLDDAQDVCRAAILRIAEAKAMPNWTDMILGKGFHRQPEGPAK